MPLSFRSSSPSSSRSSSLSDSSSSRKIRGMSIEIIPNQAVFRETFLGLSPRFSSPVTTPSEEDSPRPRTPTNNLSCAACNALTASPVGRRSRTSTANKRHAVILPVRHAGPFCRMPPPPTGVLPALPSIGEDCLVEWERRGSVAIAMNLPSPMVTPSSPGNRADYFSNHPSTRFATDAVEALAPFPYMSPRLRSSPSSDRPNGRPGTPSSPSREHRAFLRNL